MNRLLGLVLITFSMNLYAQGSGGLPPVCDYERPEEVNVNVSHGAQHRDEGAETCSASITTLTEGPALYYFTRSFPLIAPGIAEQYVEINAEQYQEDKTRWPFMAVYAQGLRTSKRLIMEAALIRDHSVGLGSTLHIEITWRSAGRNKVTTRTTKDFAQMPNDVERFGFVVEWIDDEVGPVMNVAVTTPEEDGHRWLQFANPVAVPTLPLVEYDLGLIGPGPNLFSTQNTLHVTMITPITD